MKRSLTYAGVVLACGLAATWFGYRAILANVQHEAASDFNRKTDITLDSAKDRLLRPGYGLGGARGAFAARGRQLDVAEFRRYVRARDLEREFPGVFGFGFIERVPRAQRAEYEARLSAAYGEAFRVQTDDASGLPDMLVIRSIEPLQRNRAALGFDVATNAVRRTAAESSYLSGTPTLTAPIRLKQDPDRPGALYFVPVFASGRPTRQGPGDPVIGLLYAAVSYPALMEGLVPAKGAHVSMRITDPQAAATDRLLFAAGGGHVTGSQADYSRRHTAVIGGRPLQLEFASTPAFEANHSFWMLHFGAVLGGLLSLAAAMVTFQLLRTRARAIELASEMTVDLREERKRLAGIIEGTGAGTWEWNVQTGETRFNERWAEIIGQTLESLGKTSIDTWLKFAHPEDLAKSGAALTEHFEGRTSMYECEARMRHRDGSWVWVLDRGRVLTWTPEGKPEWMFGTHLDITSRKNMELDIASQRALMETTFLSIGDAVVTSDRHGRILRLNPVAETLTGWTEAEAVGRLSTDVLHLEIEGFGGPVPSPIDMCLRERTKVGLAMDTVLVTRNGELRYAIEDSVAPLFDAAGDLLGAVMVFHDVTEKRRLSREMHHRARHDALTSLPNRDEFETQLADAMGRVATGGRPGALIFLDLDHFKVVNDTCGHSAGDELLRQVSALLRRAVRERDLVARFGGDEFVLILESCPMDRAEAVAKALCDSVDAYRYQAADGQRFRVGASVGMVCLDNRWNSARAVIQAADSACYAAKAEGRNRVVVHTDSVARDQASSGVMQWGARIEQALDENLFTLYGQKIFPISSKAGGDGLRCEVLLRLRDGRGGVISPVQFMPTAERYQLASRIDRWVLDALLSLLRRSNTGPLARVNLNLSGQSVGDRQFHRHACRAIENSGVDPHLLCVEITETAAVTNLADASVFMNELREIGVKIALDDFGSGASSFGYLKQLPIDVIKIDGQFIRGLRTSALDEAAVRCFIDVARVLSIKTVAEQVEDAATAEMLERLGVQFGQGYVHHRPEPLEKLVLPKTGPVRIVGGASG